MQFMKANRNINAGILNQCVAKKLSMQPLRAFEYGAGYSISNARDRRKAAFVSRYHSPGNEMKPDRRSTDDGRVHRHGRLAVPGALTLGIGILAGCGGSDGGSSASALETGTLSGYMPGYAEVAAYYNQVSPTPVNLATYALRSEVFVTANYNLFKNYSLY